MRLAVFDTNVIVSAGVNPDGPPSLLVEAALSGEVRLVTCPAIVDEYLDVVRRAKFLRYRFPPPWLQLLIEESLQLPDPEPGPHQLPDPDDAPFLALAHRAGAWLVSGNLRHFPPSARRGVTVLTPAAYLKHLTEPR